MLAAFSHRASNAAGEAREEFAGEAQDAVAEGLSQLRQELLAKTLTEEEVREERRSLCGRRSSATHPARFLRRARRNVNGDGDAGSAPGVEHCQEADGGAEQSRVCCRFQQRLSSGAEQDVVDRFSHSEAPGAQSAEAK